MDQAHVSTPDLADPYRMTILVAMLNVRLQATAEWKILVKNILAIAGRIYINCTQIHVESTRFL